LEIKFFLNSGLIIVQGLDWVNKSRQWKYEVKKVNAAYHRTEFCCFAVATVAAVFEASPAARAVA